MKIVSIVGARPQFIKAARLSRLLRLRHTEVLLHTGQHYDANMSAVFFTELDIPEPDVNLGIGSGSHGAQTAAMLIGIEKILLAEQPDWVLVYGDTNSTLAGALAAAKLHLRVAHVEAGIRSFNLRMPEEINRLVTDRLSSLLLCPSQTAVEHLTAEGIIGGVHLVGDVMADALLAAVERVKTIPDILPRVGVTEKGYLLATVHRAENTDDPERLAGIFTGLSQVGEPVVLPVHPRTRDRLEKSGLIAKLTSNVIVIDPVGYLDMIRLEQAARAIITDSGGIQKEAYWLEVPCITLRDETEWVETVRAGWNILAGAQAERIVRLVKKLNPPADHPALYGDGHACERIVQLLESE
jgi:UDP-GlcNAc3NAcA epimerase